MIERALRCILRRMSERTEAYAGLLSELLQWTELGTDIGGTVAVEVLAAAHVGRDRVESHQPNVTIISDHLFEYVEMLGDQEHFIAVVAPDSFELLDQLEVGTGSHEARHQSICSAVFCGDHDGATGDDTGSLVRPLSSGGRACNVLTVDLRFPYTLDARHQFEVSAHEVVFP